MFLEKFSRYFRRYEIILGARKTTAATLPLVAGAGHFSVLDAINAKLAKDKASIQQVNGDAVELVKAKHIKKDDIVVLLFHRANPNAAEPAYRKKKEGKVTVRIGERGADEDQSVSAHLIIRSSPHKDSRYYAILEEIPGLSMATVREVIAALLVDYEYKFQRKPGKSESTYCTIKAEGLKSETVADALKTGKASWITLTRPAPAKYTDGDGLWVPVNDTMKLRVKGVIEEANWTAKIGHLIETAKGDGWESFNVEISLPDERSRQVKLDAIQDARELMFVKSDRVDLGKEILVCSTEFHDDLLKKGLGVLKLIEKK
jgi:hypothetical protein